MDNDLDVFPKNIYDRNNRKKEMKNILSKVKLLRKILQMKLLIKISCQTNMEGENIER